MHSKVRQKLFRTFDGFGLAPGSMLLRLRRASIGLLGLVGAVGLGLIVFISQLGWPGVLSGPLPGTPERSGAVGNAIALSEAGTGGRLQGQVTVGSGIAPARHRNGSHSPTRHSSHPAGESNVAGSHGLVSPAAAEPQPAVDQPAPIVTPEPTGQPQPTAPPTATAVAAVPVEAPGQSGGGSKQTGSKSGGSGPSKGKDHGNEKPVTSVAKPSSDKGSKSSWHAPTTTKPPPLKPEKEKAASVPPPKPVAPPPSPTEKNAGQATGDSKETGDAGKSGYRRG